ncbi:hypothetical protein RS9916_31192 [Synechococcus sp. RS9916]|nr:hypothetical protein RS9916_31192 [Synechococcus sp. RS9916]
MIQAMLIADNELGVNSLDELIAWTSTYFHFKQALEVIPLSQEMAELYLAAFGDFRERLAAEMKKQSVLEARLPQEMRAAIDAEKPNLCLIRQLLVG